MARIAAFRALRYDPSKVSLDQVVTQPYDKITPEMRERYYAASPHNLVRIILGKQQPTDHSRDNPYTRAAQFFRDWRRQGVFQQDAEPSIYSYSQRFTIPGQKTEQERRGFIALGRIEDYSAGVVFRHEQTLAKPKADRLELLRATPAHFGQIFMLYSDPSAEIEGLPAAPTTPTLELSDEYGVLHRVWRISDPALIERVRSQMRDKRLIIADGHHRYETALHYRDERRAMAASAGIGGVTRSTHPPDTDAPYEWVMMTFVNMDSPGLTILPTHRVVHGLNDFSPDVLRERACPYFSVEECDPGISAARVTAILREAGKMGTVLLGVMKDRAFLFDRPKGDGVGILANVPFRQQSLDVVQLHKCLLEDALGLSQESIRDQQNLRYIREADQALQQVRRGEANVAFLMNPVAIKQVREIAFAGEVLPQKSTDFYPKLLSGVTIYALD
jgi:uncharacterized protein (DUF1015 family)